MRKVILGVVFTGLVLPLLYGQSSASTSQSAVLFLRIAAGARAAGMGEAFVAVADDATATHWNPAGLGKYPLYSEWYEHPLPQGVVLKQIALLRNDVPDNNYSRFDVWGITDADLYHWDGTNWQNSSSVVLSGEGQSLESYLSKATGVTDKEQLKALVHRVAYSNYHITYDSLNALAEACQTKVPEDYQLKKNFGLMWTQLLEAWGQMRVVPENLNRLLYLVKTALADEALSKPETDQIYFALEKSYTSTAPERIRVRVNVFLGDSLTALASDQEHTLWIGTSQGLISYDGEGAWKRFGQAEGLLDANVLALGPGPNGALWVATPEGMFRQSGGRFSPVMEFNAQSLGGDVKLLHLKTERFGWIASDKNLLYLDGSNWRTFVNYVVKVGDTPQKIAREYLGRQDDYWISLAANQIKNANSLSSDELQPNANLMLPFNLAIDGEITALTMDKADNLWVGTTLGVRVFDGKRWKSFGYSLHNVSGPEETPESIAKKYLNSGDESKVALLAQKIRDFNHLGDSQLSAGQRVYVYRNAAGSKILSLDAPSRDNVYVGTELGTLHYNSGTWSRYYHAGLEREKTYAMLSRDGEAWFASASKVVVYAHAQKEFTLMFAKWLPELAQDLYYVHTSYVQHLEGWGTVGANLTFLNLGSSERTDEIGQVIGEFTSYDAALTLSYGTKFSPNLALGFSTKIIYSNLAQVGAGQERGSGTGTSFALDAGLLYRTPIRRLTLGAALTNLGPDITYIDADQSDPLPRNLAVGFAYRLIDTPYNRLTLLGEINKELVGVKDDLKTEFEEAIENVGLEYWYGSYIALRGGFIYDQLGDVKTPTFGGTLQYSNYHFDFAYIPAREGLALSNTLRLSITAKF